MKRYDRSFALIVVFMIVAVIGANLLCALLFTDDEDNYQFVEVNRAYHEVQEGGLGTVIDLADYPHLTAVSYLSEDALASEKQAFFETSDSVTIKTVGTDTIEGYVKFSYTTPGDTTYGRAWMIVNICLCGFALLVIGVLLFIRQRVVKPFTKISELPEQLAKGHLTPGVKESKSRYFGGFLWGLDMLRETLEERKRNELALTKQNKTMVLSLSHDIKTPLSAIRLYTRALSDDLYENDEEKRQKALQGITDKTNEIEAFVGTIIRTSQEDFLHLEVKNDTFYLAELVDKITQYYEEKLALIKCEFCVEGFSNRLIFGDIERYAEVLENLIENAIKYGDGQLIALSFPLDEDHQCITVTNTGNTLPAGELVHLWDSFWRGSNANKESGSGLGLYISRQLMTAMNGDIYATAQGDTMSITLVCARP